jgi:hypothetical protein
VKWSDRMSRPRSSSQSTGVATGAPESKVEQPHCCLERLERDEPVQLAAVMGSVEAGDIAEPTTVTRIRKKFCIITEISCRGRHMGICLCPADSSVMNRGDCGVVSGGCPGNAGFGSN